MRERPWSKPCVSCGHMKLLDEYALIAVPHAKRFGGTQDECLECQFEWRSLGGKRAAMFRKWRPAREVA